MLPIAWRDTARTDLRQIITDIAAENPPAARRLKIRLEAVVQPLSEHPYLYRTRERAAGLRGAEERHSHCRTSQTKCQT